MKTIEDNFTISFKCSESMHEMIKQIADDEGTDVSKLLRIVMFEKYPKLRSLYIKEREEQLFREIKG